MGKLRYDHRPNKAAKAKGYEDSDRQCDKLCCVVFLHLPNVKAQR